MTPRTFDFRPDPLAVSAGRSPPPHSTSGEDWGACSRIGRCPAPMRTSTRSAGDAASFVTFAKMRRLRSYHQPASAKQPGGSASRSWTRARPSAGTKPAYLVSADLKVTARPTHCPDPPTFAVCPYDPGVETKRSYVAVVRFQPMLRSLSSANELVGLEKPVCA